MKITALTALVCATVLTACSTTHHEHAEVYAPQSAVAVMSGTIGNEQVRGVVTFTQMDGYVHVAAEVEGLAPGRHGIHVHEFGDCNCGDGKCTGGHFNPFGVDHGGPDADVRHVGDLGNLEVGADGKASYSRDDKHIALDMSSRACIIGRAIIIHGGEDDLTSQPTGAAGARLATGVIGIGKD